MQYVLTSAQMKECDRNTTEQTGIPSLVLMERAAAATAEEIMKRFPLKKGRKRILIAAGRGNNGGDGLAAGRILQEHGYPVSYALLGDRERLSEQARTQLAILKRLGEEAAETLSALSSCDILIDALFGIGLDRELGGVWKEAVEAINASDAFVVSADIPSGISADTGAVMGAAVRADLTVSYGYLKTGQILYPGSEYCGELVCRKIGILYREDLTNPGIFTYDSSDFARIPARRKDGNKGSFGKVLIVAGSRRIYGACYLAALGAYRIGAGLVRVVTARENRELLLSALPEAIVDGYAQELPKEALSEGLKWADCVLIGPGLGTDGQASAIMEYVWRYAQGPLIIDADGLNLLAARPQWLSERDRSRAVYLTPHMGEFSRLTKKSIKCCKEERIAAVREYAKEQGVILVSKDARTLVCGPDGELYINRTGNDGMATGGSGDVLSGFLAGLIAQGMRGIEAACVAVWLHGLAGDMAAKEKTPYSVMAGDLPDMLARVLARGGMEQWT